MKIKATLTIQIYLRGQAEGASSTYSVTLVESWQHFLNEILTVYKNSFLHLCHNLFVQNFFSSIFSSSFISLIPPPKAFITSSTTFTLNPGLLSLVQIAIGFLFQSLLFYTFLLQVCHIAYLVGFGKVDHELITYLLKLHHAPDHIIPLIMVIYQLSCIYCQRRVFSSA